MLIDFHTHTFPDKIAHSALEKLADVAKVPYHTDGTLAGTEKAMKGWGVDIAVLLPIATKPRQQRGINDVAAGNNHKGRFISFGTVHPYSPDALGELERIKALGLYGVKLHPDYQEFFFDDDKVSPIYEKCAELGLPVLLHPGMDPVSPDVHHASPKSVANVHLRFPELTVIAAHMGGMMDYDASEEYLVGSGVYFDTSMSSVYCKEEQFYRMVKNHGADKVLFGSDCPWSTSRAEYEYLTSMDFTQEELNLIAYKNAQRLLNI